MILIQTEVKKQRKTSIPLLDTDTPCVDSASPLATEGGPYDESIVFTLQTAVSDRRIR